MANKQTAIEGPDGETNYIQYDEEEINSSPAYDTGDFVSFVTGHKAIVIKDKGLMTNDSEADGDSSPT